MLQFLEIAGSQFSKVIQKLGERSLFGGVDMVESVERLKPEIGPLFKNNMRPFHPVRLFAVDQVVDHVERAPSIRSLIRVRPIPGQTFQKRTKNGRTAF